MQQSSINPFNQIHIKDRIIEIANSCDNCDKLFGKNQENITVDRVMINNELIARVTCLRCSHVHHYRNWKFND